MSELSALTTAEIDKLLMCCKSIEDSCRTLLDRHTRYIAGSQTKVGRIRNAFRELCEQHSQLKPSFMKLQRYVSTLSNSIVDEFTALELLTLMNATPSKELDVLIQGEQKVYRTLRKCITKSKLWKGV